MGNFLKSLFFISQNNNSPIGLTSFKPKSETINVQSEPIVPPSNALGFNLLRK